MKPMYCPGSQKTPPEQLLRVGQTSRARTPCSESLRTNCFRVLAEASSAGRLRGMLRLSSEIKIFLAEQDGNARELPGHGRTVRLSNRLHEGQEQNQRIPTEREA